jgi:8-oxo-dGTP diphosphatase
MRTIKIFISKKQRGDVIKKFRRSARAVVVDQQGKIAVLFMSKNKYYKLPGGGIDAGETIRQAAIRECYEETGCRVVLTSELGKVIEYRYYDQFRQISYCFVAHVVGKKDAPHFEAGERKEGARIVWVNLDTFIATMSKKKNSAIVPRDLFLLKRFQKLQKKNPATS